MAQRTDFGAFYPTGYIMVTFQKYEDAQQTRQDLLTGGYEERDCTLHTAQEVAEAAQRHIEDTGLTARLGKSMAAIEKHLEAARAGATFLLIYAPNELDAERIMNVISRRPHVLAHRYHRFAIEDLAAEESGTLRVSSPR
ncbi:MAG TPA: hypothetical protein VHJ19_07110 [Gammaproteobacteria bacterium]|nr:hypothetical protein [Gammaproteobacteria bacterium]